MIEQHSNHPVVFYASIWIAMALLVGALTGSVNLVRYRAMASDGVMSSGIVLSLEPGNHQTIHYSYRVDDRTYKGFGDLGFGNPPFESLRAGDSVTVYYRATDPSVSILGDPVTRLNNEIESVLGAMLLLPSILVGIIAVRRRSRRFT